MLPNARERDEDDCSTKTSAPDISHVKGCGCGLRWDTARNKERWKAKVQAVYGYWHKVVYQHWHLAAAHRRPRFSGHTGIE